MHAHLFCKRIIVGFSRRFHCFLKLAFFSGISMYQVHTIFPDEQMYKNFPTVFPSSSKSMLLFCIGLFLPAQFPKIIHPALLHQCVANISDCRSGIGLPFLRFNLIAFCERRVIFINCSVFSLSGAAVYKNYRKIFVDRYSEIDLETVSLNLSPLTMDA